MRICLRRRDFIAAFGAAAWPLAARARQGDHVRRIGVLMPLDEDDPVAKPLLSAFTQALAGLGWSDGRNLRMTFGGTAMTTIGHERSRRS
jgi:putative ABC transport system substrate-binding protein